MTCIATSFSHPHPYQPGTAAEHRQAANSGWEVCERPANDDVHKDADGRRIKQEDNR